MMEGPNTQLVPDRFLYGNTTNFKNLHEWSMNDYDTSSSSSSRCSLDTTDDASSPSSSISHGDLFELSSLMDQLPIKRGLSKFYNGKSESFTSLSKVTSTQDLAKKETPYKRRMKAGKDAYKSYTSPRPIIAKKASRTGSFIGRRSRPVAEPRLVFHDITDSCSYPLFGWSDFAKKEKK